MPAATATVVPGTPTVVPSLSSAITGTGRLEISYPLTMKLDEGDTVTAEILTNGNNTGAIVIESRSTNGQRGRLTDTIPIFPIMRAELLAPGFDVSPSPLDARRPVTPGIPVAWVWNLLARKAGEQSIGIQVSGESEIAGQRFDALVKSRTFNIRVEDFTLFERIFKTPFDSLIAILGTSGPLGVGLGLLAIRKERQRRESEAKPKPTEAAPAAKPKTEQDQAGRTKPKSTSK